MLHSREAATLVRTLVHLGAELGITSVAEGIEDVRQLDVLREIGCDVGQGYWFAQPMSAEAISGYVRDWSHPTPPAPRER